MAEETQNPAAEEEAPAKPSMLPKIMVAGFIGLVVMVETFIFFFMVPSADDVAALAEARLINKVEASMIDDGEETIDDEHETMEFPLGDYGVTFIPPGSDRNYRVDFPLYCTIYAKDEKRMEELFEKKKARFQHRIMLEVRLATIDDLMENQLGLIQRRILATSNEVLADGEEDAQDIPPILGVSFPSPGFQVYEE